ncbi:MAG: SAM-dependent methyltransferase [Bacteroidales bacterium]|jgi:16S rRNA (cytidine1402-2'-O)-methyltransferase|nr:SAM-dependent methyltransferase [Bacteroidales bacterium]
MEKILTSGTLYLIPTPIAEGPVDLVLPIGTLNVIRQLEFFIVEEIRTARRFLKSANINRKIDDLTFFIFNEHSSYLDAEAFLSPALKGKDIGLLSEAGLPCIADPGSEVVRQAHILNIQVVPLTGPSSLMLALMASGFNGQNFVFNGYLPTDHQLLIRRIKEMEKTIHEKQQTQLFIEAPYRNIKLFKALIDACHDDTLLCLAVNVTGAKGTVKTKRISAWKNTTPEIHKVPTLFLLYADFR